jgi:hypothetical protein
VTAAAYLLDRIARDPRLAYYFDPLTRSMEKLTEEYARQEGLGVEEFRREYYPRLRFEAPRCQECGKEVIE